jgi:transposase
MANDGEIVLPAATEDTDFDPLVVFDVDPPQLVEKPEQVPSAIEIMAGAVCVRLDSATPAGRIADIVRALGASA